MQNSQNNNKCKTGKVTSSQTFKNITKQDHTKYWWRETQLSLVQITKYDRRQYMGLTCLIIKKNKVKAIVSEIILARK